MTRAAPPRRFFVVAACAGFAFANMAISVPLHVVATRGGPAAAGDILAAGTVAIATGAGCAGAISRCLGGGTRLLAAALAVVAAGALTLAAAVGAVLLAAAAVVVGAGIGMFWVGSQLILSRRAGEPGSAHGFLLHYASYTGGGVLGSTLTGGLADAVRVAGFSTLAGIRVASVVAALAATAAIALWRPLAVATRVPRPQAVRSRMRTLPIQIPDLLLVGALALLLPLAPVVLAREFRLSPFSIGIVMAGVAASKVAGTLAARLIAGSNGQRRTVLILLSSGASFCLLLCAALTVSVFVTALLATALATTGAWPLVVDAAQSRVDPSARRTLTVLWNAREYALIAAMTATSGWLLGTFGSATPVFALAALLFAGAALAAAALLRRPTWLRSDAAV